MNEEQHTTDQPSDAPVVDAQAQPQPQPQAQPQPQPQPLEPQPQQSRRRLRELLAIPERDRTDALWDEIIGLEIELAPGNRAQAPQADVGQRQEPGRRQETGRRQEQVRGQQPKSGAQPARRFKKSRRGPGTPNRT